MSSCLVSAGHIIRPSADSGGAWYGGQCQPHHGGLGQSGAVLRGDLRNRRKQGVDDVNSVAVLARGR